MSDTKEIKDLNTQLADAVAAVAAANDRLAQAVTRASAASRDETEARNEVNNAQKHFDKLVAMVKQSAPRSTDWWGEGR